MFQTAWGPSERDGCAVCLKQVVEIVFIARFGLWFGLRLGFGSRFGLGGFWLLPVCFLLLVRPICCLRLCLLLAGCLLEVCFERQGCCCRIVFFLICRFRRVCFLCVCRGVQRGGRFLHLLPLFRLFRPVGRQDCRRWFLRRRLWQAERFQVRLRPLGAAKLQCVCRFVRQGFFRVRRFYWSLGC